MKFKIGDTVYWVEASANYGKEIPCPMCFGKRFVTIILGDDSQQKIECGFCQHGCDRASGIAKTWEPHAYISSGKITGFSQKDGPRYEIDYKNKFEHELFDNEKDAELVRECKYQEVKEQAEKWFTENFHNCSKKQIWSAGYHKSCIEREERTIEWHKARLCMIADKKKPAQSATQADEGE